MPSYINGIDVHYSSSTGSSIPVEQKILNLGAGNNPIQGVWNVDITKGDGIDEVYDLTQFPWKWATGSIKKIYLTHVIEHFPDQQQIIEECYRILQVGGILEIVVPHASCITAVGCLGHYRTYSYDTLRDYLSRPFYMFKTKRFKTVKQELRWWYGRPTTNVPKWMYMIIVPVNMVINKLIKLSPQLFENWWWVYVSGAKEVLWIGRKV